MKNIPKSMQGLPFDFNIASYKKLHSYDNALWYREILWRYHLFKQLSKSREQVVKHFATYRHSLGTFEEFIFGSPLKAEAPFGINPKPKKRITTFKHISVVPKSSFTQFKSISAVPKRLLALESIVFFVNNKQYKIFDDSYSRVKTQMGKTKPKEESIRFYTMREALNLYDRHADLFSDEYDYNHEQGAAQRVLDMPVHEVEKVLLLETECILKIDLSRTDEALRIDFKKFIEKHRQQVKSKFLGDERALKMELDTKKHAKWCDDKVIPYIDFLLWQMFAGQNLTDSQIENALESRTTLRTTKKEASAILTFHAIRTLKMQI